MGTRNEIRTEPARTIYLSYLFGRADRGRRQSGGCRRAPRLWTRHSAEFRSAWRSRAGVFTECVPRVASLADALTRARALTRTRSVGRSRPHTHAQVVPPVVRTSTVRSCRRRVSATHSLALSCEHARTHAFTHAHATLRDVMWWCQKENIVILLPSGRVFVEQPKTYAPRQTPPHWWPVAVGGGRTGCPKKKTN